MLFLLWLFTTYFYFLYFFQIILQVFNYAILKLNFLFPRFLAQSLLSITFSGVMIFNVSISVSVINYVIPLLCSTFEIAIWCLCSILFWYIIFFHLYTLLKWYIFLFHFDYKIISSIAFKKIHIKCLFGFKIRNLYQVNYVSPQIILWTDLVLVYLWWKVYLEILWSNNWWINSLYGCSLYTTSKSNHSSNIILNDDVIAIFYIRVELDI